MNEVFIKSKLAPNHAACCNAICNGSECHCGKPDCAFARAIVICSRPQLSCAFAKHCGYAGWVGAMMICSCGVLGDQDLRSSAEDAARAEFTLRQNGAHSMVR